MVAGIRLEYVAAFVGIRKELLSGRHVGMRDRRL